MVLSTARTETPQISVDCRAFIFQSTLHTARQGNSTQPFCQLEYTHDAFGFQVLFKEIMNVHSAIGESP